MLIAETFPLLPSKSTIIINVDITYSAVTRVSHLSVPAPCVFCLVLYLYFYICVFVYLYLCVYVSASGVTSKSHLSVLALGVSSPLLSQSLHPTAQPRLSTTWVALNMTFTSEPLRLSTESWLSIQPPKISFWPHFSTESLFTETVEHVNKGAVKEIRGEDIRGQAYVILIIVTCQL